MDLTEATPVVLTWDEEPNIERTLRQVSWARDVVVVDSFSVDATVGIARRFPNVRVFQRETDTLAGQTNHGLEKVRTPWVLLLDADHVVSEEFIAEMRTLSPPPGVAAYRAPFVYSMAGRPLRATLYPPRIVLFDRRRARAWQDGHAHRIAVDGDVGDLRAHIVHDDRKSFANFVERQRRYMRQEAVKLRTAKGRDLNLASRVRRLVVVAPIAVVVHALFVKGLILDGWPGLRYVWERFVAEAILSWELLRRRSAPDRPQREDSSHS